MLILGGKIGIYVYKGNLYAIKKVAAFSKTVTVYCCKDGKNKTYIEIGKNQFKKDGDLYWKHEMNINPNGSIY